MFKKKSLLILLIILFTLLTGTVYAQWADAVIQDSPFDIYSFAEMGIMGIVGILPENDYLDPEARTFYFGFEFGAQSWTPMFAMYPTFAGTLWEDGDQSVYAFGRIRIKLQGNGWKAAPVLESYGAQAIWYFSDTGYLTVYDGNVNLFAFGSEVYLLQTLGNAYIEAGFDLDMMSLVINLMGPFGDDAYGVSGGSHGYLNYDYTDGWTSTDGTAPYLFTIQLLGIDIEPMTLNVILGYQFHNTFEWDSASEYGGGSYTGIVNEYPVWLGYMYEKGGALLAQIGLDVSIEGIMDIYLEETFYYGMTAGQMMSDTYLTIALTMVDGLDLQIRTEFYMDMVMGTDDIDGFVLDAVDAGFWWPVFFRVAYSLDMGGMVITPFLDAAADIAGIAFFGDDPEITRGWYIAAGANIDLAGGYVRLPFQVYITNAPGEGFGIMGDPLYYGHTVYIYGDTSWWGATDLLIAKTYISFGIMFILD
jgi:hypothetical protein